MSDEGLPTAPAATVAEIAAKGSVRCNQIDVICITGIIVVCLSGLAAVTFWKVPVDTVLAVTSPVVAGFLAFLKGS
jgi:hypothetical protein